MQHRDDPIAIVGLGCLFPGAIDIVGLWRTLAEARDLMTEVPADYWLVDDYYDRDPRAVDKVYSKRGAFLPKVVFDPLKFGVPPKLLPSTDTCQLLALMVADQVVTDAANAFAKLDRQRIGVILGVCSGLELLGEMSGRLQRPLWRNALRAHGLPEDDVTAICDRISAFYTDWNESTFPGLLSNVVAGRIASNFDLGGTNCTTDAACASSFAALAMAINELRLGQADLMITGGADTANDPFTYMCFSKTPALSPSGTSRPFAESADGMMIGEGLGMLALRRLADAERDGDRIYAVIRGLGSSSDGRSKSIYAPRWEGQRTALERCYGDAGYTPASVELVEAHGTGTFAGDLAELTALRAVFEATGCPASAWCALGSIKSQLGHTKAAAGAAGLLKIVLALHHRTLPPTLNVDRPADRLELEGSPFYLNAATRPWIRGADHPRRASVSSFGFGGTNFHVAVEEYLGPRAGRLRSLPSELVILGSDDRRALAAECRRTAAELGPVGSLVHIARASQDVAVASCRARLAVVASDPDDLRAKLEHAAGSIEHGSADTFALPSGVYFSERANTGDLALLFPGQGSQYLGMGGDLAMAFDASRAVWDAEASQPIAGEPALHVVVFPPPAFREAARSEAEARLTAPEGPPPASAATSVSMLALLRAIGVRPACVGGHSYGELAALYAAGVYDEATLLRLSRKRGELMSAARGGGTMLAVTASLEQVEAFLATAALEVTIANHNAPDQVVLSGATAAIEGAEAQLTEAGLHHVRLSVGAAFHSPLVAPATAGLRAFLASVELARPAIEVYASSTASVYPDEPEAIRDTLAQGLAQRVRFVEQVDAMYARGVRTFVEVGPGGALTSMVRKICHQREHEAISMDVRGRDGVTGLWRAVGRLIVAGHHVDLSPLWAEYTLVPDPRLAPKPRMAIEINGTNYGKKYPPAAGVAGAPAPQRRPRLEPEPAQPVTNGASEAPHVASRGIMTSHIARSAPSPVNGHGNGPGNGHGNGHRNGHGPDPHGTAASSAGESAILHHAATTELVAPAFHDAPIASPGWADACVELQARTAETHLAVLRCMADSHLAFLRTAESAVLATLGSERPVAPVPAREVVPAMSAPVIASSWPPPPDAAVAIAPSSPVMPSVPPPAIPTSPPAAATDPPAPTRAAPRAISPELADALARRDFEGMVLQAVSSVTGYPAEILSLDQALESDLGIDSISRVEILASFSDLIPDLAKLDLGQVGQIKTLADVVQFIERNADRITTGAS